MSDRVIVFGPTGNVASVAACTAQEHGAKVFLAMRNVDKAIPGLSAAQEKQGGFERVQADLTQPDTVAAAVRQTGAKHAFTYVAHGTPDHMKATLEALKSAGITFVVFLSSYTITGDLEKVLPSDVIPYVHAKVEINLQEIYGPKNFVAIRAGSFATNTLQWKASISSGQVKVYGVDAKFDYITPGDMGRVSGTILAKGQQGGQNIVYLYGPQRLSQREAITLLSKAVNKDCEIKPMTEQEALEHYNAIGFPEAVAKYVVKLFGAVERGEKILSDAPLTYEEGVSNISKYTGKPAVPFIEWAEENKGLFR